MSHRTEKLTYSHQGGICTYITECNSSVEWEYAK